MSVSFFAIHQISVDSCKTIFNLAYKRSDMIVGSQLYWSKNINNPTLKTSFLSNTHSVKNVNGKK